MSLPGYDAWKLATPPQYEWGPGEEEAFEEAEYIDWLASLEPLDGDEDDFFGAGLGVPPNPVTTVLAGAQTMKAYADFRAILDRCAFPDFRFAIDDTGTHMRVECVGGRDNVTGEPMNWNGRWWRLSAYMTDGEVVQTAFLAILTAMEHEARETFRFDGVTVFDPHYDIHKLVELRRSADAIKERDPK